jgi:hypothetical protein
MSGSLPADQEQPIGTIAMFLSSYPPEEAAIDKLLFRKSEEEKTHLTYRITPEYE